MGIYSNELFITSTGGVESAATAAAMPTLPLNFDLDHRGSTDENFSPSSNRRKLSTSSTNSNISTISSAGSDK